MTLQEAFEKLAAKYGTHKNAALALGYTPEHYRALRNGRSPVPERMMGTIIKAAEVAEASDMPCPPPLPAQAGAEARA